jgi:hypothetical protein
MMSPAAKLQPWLTAEFQRSRNNKIACARIRDNTLYSHRSWPTLVTAAGVADDQGQFRRGAWQVNFNSSVSLTDEVAAQLRSSAYLREWTAAAPKSKRQDQARDRRRSAEFFVVNHHPTSTPG